MIFPILELRLAQNPENPSLEQKKEELGDENEMYSYQYRYENTWVRTGMSSKWTLKMEKPHEVGQLNVHIVQSSVKYFRFQLIAESKVMQTPRCRS